MEQAIRELIRTIPDFPKEGVQFKDITPVLKSPEGFQKTIEWFTVTLEAIGDVEVIAGIESRGFILAAAVAEKMGLGFIPIRKPGKLPYEVVREEYDLEYGKDAVEMHADAVAPGTKVALIDDVLATGGTATAASSLIRQVGGEITAAVFLIELDFLKGRDKLKQVVDSRINSLIHY